MAVITRAVRSRGRGRPSRPGRRASGALSGAVGPDASGVPVTRRRSRGSGPSRAGGRHAGATAGPGRPGSSGCAGPQPEERLLGEVLGRAPVVGPGEGEAEDVRPGPVERALVGEIGRVGDGHVGRHSLKHAGSGAGTRRSRSGQPNPSCWKRHRSSPAEQAPEVVDLAGVVGVVGDHRRDDPAGRASLAPVRQAWHVQLRVVREGGDVADERAVRRLEPGDDLGAGDSAVAPGLDLRRREPQRAAPERVVVVHHLARTDVDRRCRGSSARRLGQRVPSVRRGTVAMFVSSAWLSLLCLDPGTAERIVEQVEQRLDPASGSASAIVGPIQTRVWYSPVRVSTRIVSPASTKIGTWSRPGRSRSSPACGRRSGCRRRSRARCRRRRGRP